MLPLVDCLLVVYEFLSYLNWLNKVQLSIIQDQFNVFLAQYFMHIIAFNVLNFAFGHSFSLNASLHVFQEDFLKAEDLANSQLLRLVLDDLDVNLHVPS